MEPPREELPNRQKIDQLLGTIKAGETEGALTACESFIVEDEFFQWEERRKLGENENPTNSTSWKREEFKLCSML